MEKDVTEFDISPPKQKKKKAKEVEKGNFYTPCFNYNAVELVS